MVFLGLGWLLAWPRVGLPCHPSRSPGQHHPHLGIKQAAVRGEAGSLVAELSREGRGLRGQEVLSDAHGAHQALHLWVGRGSVETRAQASSRCPSCPRGLLPMMIPTHLSESRALDLAAGTSRGMTKTRSRGGQRGPRQGRHQRTRSPVGLDDFRTAQLCLFLTVGRDFLPCLALRALGGTRPEGQGTPLAVWCLLWPLRFV